VLDDASVLELLLLLLELLLLELELSSLSPPPGPELSSSLPPCTPTAGMPCVASAVPASTTQPAVAARPRTTATFRPMASDEIFRRRDPIRG
jgi:hypothetical protein